MAAAALLTGSLGSAYFSVDTTPIAPLVATQAVIDRGMVDQHSIVSADFEVRNASSDLLEIKHLTLGCEKCTKAKVADEVIFPGDCAMVHCEWDTGADRGESGATVVVHYTSHPDDRRGRLKLQIRGFVKRDFNVEPSRLHFDRHSARKSVECWANRNKSISVVRVSCTHAAFMAQLSDEGRQISVTFDAAKWVPDEWRTEPPHAELVVETDNPYERLIRVPLLIADQKVARK